MVALTAPERGPVSLLSSDELGWLPLLDAL
jgi:hypothetical protein